MRGNFKRKDMDTNPEIKDAEKVYQYWLTSSDKDYEVMLNLFQSRHYNWALFLGHIVLEKLLKAYFVKKPAHTRRIRTICVCWQRNVKQNCPAIWRYSWTW